MRNKSWVLGFFKNVTKVGVSAILLSVAVGFLEEASLNLDKVDTLCTFSVGSFLSSLAIIFYQNLAHWHNYGIFKHNDFYSLTSGFLNYKAVFKTIFSFGLYSLSLTIVFKNLRRVNWLVIFTSVPTIMLLLRHCVQEHRISWI